MTAEWLHIIFSAFWCGIAALGFALLFTTPSRALPAIFLSAFVAGIIKFTIILPGTGGGIILASLASATAAGFISIPFSHWRHVPPVVISIPSVIPMVPGFLAYKTILGLIKFIHHTDAEVLTRTVHDGVMALFIIFVLSLGLTLPMLLFRIDTVKNVRLMKTAHIP